MKQFLLIIAVFFICSCKKEDQLTPSQPDNMVAISTNANSLAVASLAVINVKDQGAKGNGITDDTKAIRNALIYAKSHNIANIYFPDGEYMIGETGNGGGIIKLVDGVGMIGNGPTTCHIKLTGGRYNPNSIFYQEYIGTPFVGNLVIQGIDFNGNLALQKYDAYYQFCHALSINNGKNIEVKNCKFQNFRGDGLLFGDCFETKLNLRTVANVSVHDSEFFNIYREGTMFCAVNGAAFYNNNVHGDGYLVAGVDIERHSVNESVLNVSVYNNTFNFTDGYGPVERGGAKVRYRRAVSMGFFYGGYKNGIADSLSGHHKIYNNKIYQGQIDCWGMINVSITGNAIKNTYENISGVNFLTVPAINISDAAKTTGLINVVVNSNTISSAMMGNGILFNNYSQIQGNANIITGTLADAINLLGSSGNISNNTISDVGAINKPAAGIIISGNSSGLIISGNQGINTTSGKNRTMDYVVKIVSANNGKVVPKIMNNKGRNMLSGVISMYWLQLTFAQLINNLAN
ncbi:glycosyl hydrolase family 28-related protein [Mucilaginibacter sp.]|uniref:glycosyl hydrolase family 28-related protein n=1 Tax=Mucilaginibacter sp. TaxID=1882438 RepID=UPI0025DEF13D|nr:glycosyl hydrolase family 28-related protein [Mucilaginibacter sp.]